MPITSIELGNVWGGLVPYYHKDENSNIVSAPVDGGSYTVYSEIVVLFDIPDLRQNLTVSYNGENITKDGTTSGEVLLKKGQQLLRTNKPNRSLNYNEYRINEYGFLFFHPILEGKSVDVSSYHGKGVWLIPADRIFFKNGNNIDINETLQHFIDRIKEYEFKGDWKKSETYTVNNQVFHNGTTYIAIQDVGYGTEIFNKDYWRILAAGLGEPSQWKTYTQYSERDIIADEREVYLCKNSHKSSGNFNNDKGNWTLLISVKKIYDDWADLKARIEMQEEEWQENEAIRVSQFNDLREQSATAIGNAITAASAAGVATSSANTATLNANNALALMSNYKFMGNWSSSTAYKKNNVVFQDGTGYIALDDNTNKSPKDNSSNWNQFATGLNWRGVYSSSTTYYPRDLVINTNKTVVYMCINKSSGYVLTNTSYFTAIINIQELIDLAAIGEPAISNGSSSDYWNGNKTWSDFSTSVRNAGLLALALTNSAVANGDSVQTAFGKLQAQVNDRMKPGNIKQGTNVGLSSNGNDVTISANIVDATSTAKGKVLLGASGGAARFGVASDVGLGNVTNESKTTMFTNSALTGNPTAPTQNEGDNSTKIATTEFVQNAVANNGGSGGGGKKLIVQFTTAGTHTFRPADYGLANAYIDAYLVGGGGRGGQLIGGGGGYCKLIRDIKLNQASYEIKVGGSGQDTSGFGVIVNPGSNDGSGGCGGARINVYACVIGMGGSHGNDGSPAIVVTNSTSATYYAGGKGGGVINYQPVNPYDGLPYGCGGAPGHSAVPDHANPYGRGGRAQDGSSNNGNSGIVMIYG